MQENEHTDAGTDDHDAVPGTGDHDHDHPADQTAVARPREEDKEDAMWKQFYEKTQENAAVSATNSTNADPKRFVLSPSSLLLRSSVPYGQHGIPVYVRLRDAYRLRFRLLLNYSFPFPRSSNSRSFPHRSV